MESQGLVVRNSRKRKTLRIVSVFLLAGFSVAVALSTFVYLWVPYEDTGISFDGGIVNAVAKGSPAAKAGLKVGDRLDPAMPFFERQRFVDPNKPARGQTYAFTVIRQGAPRTISVHAVNRTNPAPWSAEDIVEYVVGMLSFFTLIVVGTLLVLLRPNPLTWLFFLFCVGNPTAKYFNAVDVLSSLQMPWGFVLNIFRLTLMTSGYIAFVYFALRFPKMRAAGWRARLERVLPVLFVFYLAYLYQGWFLWSYSIDVGPILGWPYFGVAISLLFEVIAVASLTGTYRHSSTQDKHRYSFVIAGLLITYSVLLFREALAALGMLEGDTLWFCIWTQSFSTFAPLALAYGILRHRVIDIRFVVNRAVVYGAMTTILVVLLASSYWLTERLLQQTRVAAFLQLVAAIVIGVSLQQSYKRIESAINRWFFKRVYIAQEYLSRLGAALPAAESTRALETLLTTEPVNALDLTAGAVFHRRDDGLFERSTAVGWSDSDNACFASDDPLVLHLQAKHGALSLDETAFPQTYVAAKTNNAEEAIPIFSRGSLAAIALYGAHANGTKIDPVERSALEKLAAPAELAYDSLRIRLENVRRLSDILERLDGVAYDELHYYLADQAIAGIPERSRSALTACAAIPDATDEDVALATGDASDGLRLQEMATSSALIRRHANGSYTVHPLIAHMLLQRFGAVRTQMLVRCADAWKARNDRRRAATLYSAAGMAQAAADELEAIYSENYAPAALRTDRYADFCRSLEFHQVLSRPNVWLKRCMARLFEDGNRNSVREGFLVIEGAHGQISTPNEVLIRTVISWMRLESGEQLAEPAFINTAGPLPAAVRAFAHLVQAQAYGRDGKTSACREQLRASNELFVPFDEFAGMQITIRACYVERVTGHAHEDATLLRHATGVFDAVQSRMALWSACEAAVGAWLYSDTGALLSTIGDLETRVERDDAPALKHLVASLAGRFDEPLGMESPRHLAFAFLAQACNANDAAAARQCAERADAAAVLAHEPFIATLTGLARAFCDSLQRLDHLARAVESSECVESTALHRAVHAIVLGEKDAGMLTPFVSRLTRTREGARHPLTVRVAACAVMRDGKPLQLSERETALAMAIARRPEPSSAVELAELLWPDLDEQAGLRAVQTYVHRLRQRLDDPDAVELVSQGYRYRADTVVDLRQMEQLLTSLSPGALGHFPSLVLTALSNELNVPRPGYTIGWEWFGATERRMEELLRAAEYRIAMDALQSGLFDDALACARKIIARDELDEGAWEIVIRSCIAAGDKAGASRELRRYREILQRELNAEPSEELCRLLAVQS